MVLLDPVNWGRKIQRDHFMVSYQTYADEYQAQGLRAGEVSMEIARSMISVPELMIICRRRSVRH